MAADQKGTTSVVPDQPPAWAQALIDRIGQLEGQIRETKAAQPQFKPMETPQPKGIKAALAGMRNGEERMGVRHQVFVDQRGEKLPSGMLAQFPVRFGVGDQVRINPEASERFKDPEGVPTRTWGDVLAKVNSAGVGIVTKIGHLQDSGEWKYWVTVPGLGKDAFDDGELLAA